MKPNNEIYVENFCRNIKFLAKKQGHGIGDIEEALGRRAGYISRLEGRKRFMKFEEMVTMTSFVGLSIGDIPDLLLNNYAIQNELDELNAKIEELNKAKEALINGTDK